MATNNNTRDGKDLNISENNMNPVAIHSSSENDRSVSAVSHSLASQVSSSLSGHSTSTSSVSSIVAAEGTDNKDEGRNPSAARRKRVRDEDSSTEGEMSRAELKCVREKKRRRDMNKVFEELVSAVGKIDPKINADAALQDMVTTGLLSLSSSLNRVEVISRAAAILERLHRENKEQKIEITELKAKLEAATNEKNQVRALLAANNNSVSGALGIQVNQGPTGLLQTVLTQSSTPAVPFIQIPLALPMLTANLGAHGANVQLSAPAEAQAAGNIFPPLRTVLGLSSQAQPQQQVMGLPQMDSASILMEWMRGNSGSQSGRPSNSSSSPQS